MDSNQQRRPQLVEKATTKILRTSRGKRKRAEELSKLERVRVREEFRELGAGSGPRIAQEVGAQHPAVLEVILTGYEGRLEKLERGLDALIAERIMRGSRSSDRKLPARERSGLRFAAEEVAS